MHFDSAIRLRIGETGVAWGSISTTSGTIDASSGAVCSLYDSTGSLVSNWSAVNVTGFDDAAGTTSRVWKTVNTTSPTALTEGFYLLVFQVTVVGSDSITRVFEPAVGIWIDSVA